MNTQHHDDLEQLLGRELHGRVDGMHDAPLGLSDVRGRAGRIQRNRRIAVGAGVVAAVAVIVPTAMAVGPDLSTRTELPPATSSPSPSPAYGTEVELTMDGMPMGDAPAIEYFVEDGVVLPGEGLQPLDQSYQAMIPNPGADGWLAMSPSRGELIDMTSDFQRTSARPITGRIASTPDRGQIAFVSPEAGSQSLVVLSTSDPEAGQVWDLPARPTLEPVGFIGDGRVLLRTGDEGGALTIAEPDGSTTAFAGEYEQVIATNARTGLVSVQTRSKGDGSGCFGVVDAASGTSEPVWDTCDHSLGGFSPDGRYVLASHPYQSGFGKTSVTILDAEDGTMVVTFQPDRRTQVAMPQTVWESDGSVLSTAQQGDKWAVIRMGVDGTLEAAVEPEQTADPYADWPFYLGGGLDSF